MSGQALSTNYLTVLHFGNYILIWDPIPTWSDTKSEQSKEF